LRDDRPRACRPLWSIVVVRWNEIDARVRALRLGTLAARSTDQEEHMADTDIWVTTANHFDGYRVVRYLGVVRGITVRSRSVIGSFGASLQTLIGGNITLYTELAEHARSEAYELMKRHARDQGCNAIIAMRYDANEISQGVTEVLAYGTAVVIEKAT
jgi:uncharacterized protein YbjQ (UPF0145 family)